VSGLKSLFGKRPQQAAPADAVVAHIQQVAQSNGLAALIYKTAAGYRVILPGAHFEAGSAAGETLLEQFGADPLYVRLCRMQQSFRARLTPKPWRCGLAMPPCKFPFVTPDEESRFKAWESKYNSSLPRYATCRLVASTPGERDLALEDLIRYHDEETKAASTLPLA
jgi:hypothetical protein